MIYDDILEIIKEAQYPISLSGNLNIGEAYADDRNQKYFEFFPCDVCSAFSNVRQYQEAACVTVHTHGIEVVIDGVRVNIHNSQIIVFDYIYFDDTIEFKRSETRGSRVGLGWMLAGPIGATVGLASSFGKGNEHITSHILIIAYWNTVTKAKEIIQLEDKKGVAENVVPKLVDYWREQIAINQETGRLPIGANKAGVGEAGCLNVLLLFAFVSLYICYAIIEQAI